MSAVDLGAHLDAAAVTAVVAAAGAALMPRVVALLPEPDEPAPDKPTYAALASRPGLALRYALWAAVAGGAIGLARGWDWALLVLLPLVVLGVALAHIDFRTRLLPKRLVLPAYPVLLVLLAASALLAHDPHAAVRALWGWLVASALYWLLWRFTRGMGYGDVRMSGLLGLALGHLGWTELGLGLYAAFVVGVVGWIPLRLLKLTEDRNFPFGPFMLVGAWVGVVGVAVLPGAVR